MEAKFPKIDEDVAADKMKHAPHLSQPILDVGMIFADEEEENEEADKRDDEKKTNDDGDYDENEFGGRRQDDEGGEARREDRSGKWKVGSRHRVCLWGRKDEKSVTERRVFDNRISPD